MELEAKIKTLKAMRGSIKGQMTKLHNFVQTVVDKEDIDGFQSKLARAKVLLKQFEDTENKMFELDPNHESAIIDFAEQFYVVEAMFNKHIREYNAGHQQPCDITVNQSMNTSTVAVEVRLPKINIEPFTGQYTEWQSFYDLFVKTIHENASLSPAQKFQYLKGFLKGDAFNLLKHISVTETNYFEAFRKLCERYDRKKHTIRAFIHTFMNQPTINQANATNIRKLLDTSDEVIRGLKALGKEAESRDVWLLHILEEKLDSETRALWAQTSSNKDLLTLDDLFKFLLNRSDALESLKPRSSSSKKPPFQKSAAAYVTTEVNSCPLCKLEHVISECNTFKKLSLLERRQIIKSDNRCFNCLRINHPVFRCLSKSRCSTCGKKHHTLLHLDDTKEQTVARHVIEHPNHPTKKSVSTMDAQAQQTLHAGIQNNCILPTALVKILDNCEEEHDCRILLDSGSVSTFISERCCNRLKLPRHHNRTMVSGIGGSGSQVTKGKVEITLRARESPHNYIKTEALVLSKLCSKLPSQSFSANIDDMNINLADPKFNITQDIDIILGVQQVFNVMLDGRIRYQDNVIAIETMFGWVLGGEMQSPELPLTHCLTSQSNTDAEALDTALKLFWEIENIPTSKVFTNEEDECERLFKETTSRDAEGRYIVQLPLKKEFGELGRSMDLAISRLRSMERKFERNKTFKEAYIIFMDEYRQLGHMVEIDESKNPQTNYLPHHGITKSTGAAAKIRVVFDASAKTSSGKSLNDLLMVGPTVQPTLYSILMRFRIHRIAISADVEKMYRQILVRNDDRRYQGIVWRSDRTSLIKHYELTTLTYGTSSAPYLATRVLNEIADQNTTEYPAAANILKKATYVDDIMSGANTIEEALQLKEDIINILQGAGMKLRKWISNSIEFLSTTPVEDRIVSIKDIASGTTMVKVLGLQWNPKEDNFTYCVELGIPVYTKRQLLSECSQIFDPLGWLAPVIVKIKILFQSLWLFSLDWDDELPPAIKQKWHAIREELKHLEKVKIPRWLHTPQKDAELHGFCDASERAYAAVVYIRLPNEARKYSCHIVTAKSKVAPIKTISVARLELCAALLLSNLIASVNQILENHSTNITCWTDSMIVLDWLSDVPSRWKTFVGNRTSQILDIVPRVHWRHVPTKDNPADIASRGILPQEVIHNKLWWAAPEWLCFDVQQWPYQQRSYGYSAEERKNSTQIMVAECSAFEFPNQLFEKISSFKKAIKVVAMVNRFVQNTLQSTKRRNGEKLKGPISLIEMEEATIMCCKYIQREQMNDEIVAVQQTKPLKMPLAGLKPFLDDKGILRIGGRIDNSMVSYSMKHPIILPASSGLTNRIIEDYHHRYLHAGPQLLLGIIRQRYWIINGKQAVRKITNKCVTCFKNKPISLTQEMGNLPQYRVEHIRAFLKVGTDFAGPFYVYYKRGRGQKPTKVYVCLLVCMTTRALHIELTMDLTTNSFLSALKRFVARRGLCTDIYSDCGSNYIGAGNRLREVFSFLQNNKEDIYNTLLNENINWHYNPPNAPHFGGLWEAAVKSMKYHLRRVIGETILTVEEFQTLLVEVEAILNSRPLCRLSSDDVNFLTPAHFIIGHQLTLVPEINVMDEKIAKLSRYEVLQQMRQHFWRRWHLEYLTSMQSRSKWKSAKPNIKINDIVLVMDRNSPPGKWLLGRIIEVISGSDGLVRVVIVKTQTGTVRRAIHSLCKIPVESDDSKSGRMLDQQSVNEPEEE